MSQPLFRWLVQAPVELSQLLEQHGLFAALRDERVFVDGQRAVASRLLACSSRVEVFAPRPNASIEILYQRDDVVAVHKPAALPTEPDRNGANSVMRQLALSLERPGAELFALSRLDVGVSGVLLVAGSESARQRLLQERARGSLLRRYVALAAGVPAPAEGQWQEALGKGSGGKRVLGGRDEQSAHTRYRVVATARPVAHGRPATSLLALSPSTGRTHQLRVHAAAHGAPLLGDRKYAGPARYTAPDGAVRTLPQVLLHAAWVEWGTEPARQRVTCEPSSDWVDIWLALGGEAAAIQRALD